MATGSHLHGYGLWMPEDFKLRRAWLSSLINKTDPRIPKFLHGDEASPNPVDKFRGLIEKNSSLYMLANGMFEEVPTKAPYDRDPTTLKKQVRNYKTMLYLFNTLLTRVPEWFGGDGIPNGLVGFPYNVIVDWPMGTESGRQFFLDPRVNNCLKDILNSWGEFLKDPTAGGSGPDGGNQALIDAGWTKDEAIQQLENKANEATGTNLPFDKLFIFPAGGDRKNFFQVCVLG